MKIMKFEHSGYLVEKEGRGVLIDPVELEKKLPEFDNIDAVIITHLHGDHFQPEVVNRICEVNPKAKVFATEDNAGNIDEAEVARDGRKVNVGAFELGFFGKDHAEIVEGEVPCQNIGVVVAGVFATPGDSFDKPPVVPKILAVPIAAPWMKIREAMDYIGRARPNIVVPAHDGLNSEMGNTVCDNWIRRAAEEIGAEYRGVHYGEID